MKASTVVGLLVEGGSLFLAELQTSNFSFSACGTTEQEARAAMVRGLEVHARQYQLESKWWHAYDDAINVTPLKVGSAYRDGEELR